MPNIRIMNWNIEQFSWNKIRIGNMAAAIAHVIVSQNVDIVGIVELKTSFSREILNNLMAALNARAAAVGGFGADAYTTAVMSAETGTDRYGFILKDPAVTEPIIRTAGPAAPIRDITQHQFQTMTGLGLARGTAAAPVNIGPRGCPRIDLHVLEPASRAREVKRPPSWAGQPLAGGQGMSLGRGFRHPCLCMFRLPTAAGQPVISLVPCHYGASKSLSSPQIQLLRYLHIAQLYKNINGSHIVLDGAAVRVENLILTGDFNLDFLQYGNPHAVQIGVQIGYATLTDTLVGQGTGAAAAAAAPPRGVAGGALPLPATPALRKDQIDTHPYYFNAAQPNSAPLSLRAAVTNVGTILHHFHPPPTPPPADLAALRSACFDNFFFGGTHLQPSFQMLAPPAHMPAVAHADCGLVVDVPAMIKRPGNPAAPGFDVRTIAAAYLPNTKAVGYAPRLRGAGAPGLTMNDRLIGARLLSDHLPVVVEFNIP